MLEGHSAMRRKHPPRVTLAQKLGNVVQSFLIMPFQRDGSQVFQEAVLDVKLVRGLFTF